MTRCSGRFRWIACAVGCAAALLTFGLGAGSASATDSNQTGHAEFAYYNSDGMLIKCPIAYGLAVLDDSGGSLTAEAYLSLTGGPPACTSTDVEASIDSTYQDTNGVSRRTFSGGFGGNVTAIEFDIGSHFVAHYSVSFTSGCDYDLGPCTSPTYTLTQPK